MVKRIQVAVVMGSASDNDTMQHAVHILKQLEISYETHIISAHRTPDKLFTYAESAAQQGIEIIIAGAGGAAHLPGMLAAKTPLPILGVPIQSKVLNGIDSLLSIVQMPAGVPVATFAIGKAGAINAALFAAAILAAHNVGIQNNLIAFRERQTTTVLNQSLEAV